MKETAEAVALASLGALGAAKAFTLLSPVVGSGFMAMLQLWILCAFFGAISAAFGSILRDVLLNEFPSALRPGVFVLEALFVGSAVLAALRMADVSQPVAVLAGFLITLVIRAAVGWRASRGGAGKTTLAEALLFTTSALGLPLPVIIDADQDNPDLALAYRPNVNVTNLKRHGFSEVIDICDANRDKPILVVTGANERYVIEERIEELDGAAEFLSRQLRLVWPLDRDKDSFRLLPDVAQKLPSADLFVVRNGLFGEYAEFEAWERSETRKKLMIPSYRDLYLPEIPDRVIRKFKADRKPFAVLHEEGALAERMALEACGSAWSSTSARCSWGTRDRGGYHGSDPSRGCLSAGAFAHQEELAAVKASADRLSLDVGDTWLHAMILFEEVNQRVARLEDAITRREEGFLVRFERRLPWALLALVAIVAFASAIHSEHRDEGRVFTPAMLAERWSVSTSVVRKEIRSGRLRAFQAGVRQWRVRLEDLEEYECPGLSPHPISRKIRITWIGHDGQRYRRSTGTDDAKLPSKS